MEHDDNGITSKIRASFVCGWLFGVPFDRADGVDGRRSAWELGLSSSRSEESESKSIEK